MQDLNYYTLSEAWSGVNWADLMAAQGVIKIGPKGALGSHEIRPIHSAPSLGQSIAAFNVTGDFKTPPYRSSIGKHTTRNHIPISL